MKGTNLFSLLVFFGIIAYFLTTWAYCYKLYFKRNIFVSLLYALATGWLAVSLGGGYLVTLERTKNTHIIMYYWIIVLILPLILIIVKKHKAKKKEKGGKYVW